MAPVTLQILGGPLESVAQIAGIAGTLVLALMIVALGTLAYKQLRGDGVEWPDDKNDDDGVSPGNTDDEWDYY
ncbi:hypothetical protein [Halobellus clavatus]|jgi:hypothetical protein|uniref:Uncharacterized protein n=1 Tax=Halobellus clavatus TaxID=660517 RepID=A0A1H3FR17_9EURY|nr:hypothetical protein [Halobellus clavatus]SDX93305.1 hypothetical protein SAMN04487946_104119 [Halobellus clavatus]